MSEDFAREEIERMQADPRWQRLRVWGEVSEERRRLSFVQEFEAFCKQQESEALERMAQLAPGDTAGLMQAQIDLWAARQVWAWLGQLDKAAHEANESLNSETYTDT